MAKLFKQFKLFIQGFLLLNILWFFASILIDTNVVPNPIDIYKNARNLLTDDIQIHILYSLKRIAIGLALSLAVGTPIGILIAYSKKANKILIPTYLFMLSSSKVSVVTVSDAVMGNAGWFKNCHYFFNHCFPSHRICKR